MMALCYKDQTFCSSDCKNDKCFRNYTDVIHEAARKWWSHDPDNAPVAFSDFSKTCPEYVK
jgi:hypothetical protein